MISFFYYFLKNLDFLLLFTLSSFSNNYPQFDEFKNISFDEFKLQNSFQSEKIPKAIPNNFQYLNLLVIELR